jgi:hypothetical protein
MQIRRSKNLRQARLRSPPKIKKPDGGETFATLRLQKLHPKIISSRQHFRDAKRNANAVSIQPAQSREPKFFAIRSPWFIDNATISDELNHRGGSRAIVRVRKPRSNTSNAKKRFASVKKYGTETGFVPQKTGEELTLRVDPGGDELRRSFEKIWKLADRFQKGNVAAHGVSSLAVMINGQATRHRFRCGLLKMQSRRECECETRRQISVQIIPH